MANASLVAPRPPPHGEYTLEALRPRKRLQKPCLKQPKQQPSTDTTGPAASPSPVKSKASRGTRLWDRARTPPLQTIPPQPDLSDAKWADYLHRSPSIGCPEHKDGMVDIIPEFAHLGVHRLERRSQMESHYSTPDSITSTESARLRTHAKTPVFRIGQLEGTAARMKRQLKRQSAEVGSLDFERSTKSSPWRSPRSAPLPGLRHLQGRSLPPLPGRKRSRSELTISSPLPGRWRSPSDLTSVDPPQVGRWRSPSDVSSVDSSLPGRQRSPSDFSSVDLPPTGRWRSPSDLSSVGSVPSGRWRSRSDLSSVGSPPPLERGGQSPVSEAGTLVSFDDETIYFRPTSFCMEEPTSAPVKPFEHPRDPPKAPSSPAQTSIGLQICLELLTRELSSTIHERASRSSSTTQSQLQVWVMIEAYERLREQLVSEQSMRLSPDDSRAAETMINTWLRALCAIHESLTKRQRTGCGDSDGLPREDLD
ncbi:hypothetical protein MGG_14639 [Pyricularia oryzae 70-15]|uniref:Mating-type switching protein swi10 n=3 Tax=Pyricularia oryzae TaxID=318829 RepID=G4ND23_PYRO7|nr:uncharacterized protein MGG_14639 [Pyricularia oryzae 70-15]EHA48365.1 hypothetical protein MGG_14639 [Pyricularia oryzae 70-15]ELQ40090.1 hypothetical protein OOU_Y34scaffold00462g44 [Pyricularia oryzae Y34]KAI7918474.1 hypothetical protein M9X92_006877 [Pyricularia oryzae]KAI7923691.1 hypothetical protein M0657_005007 [Pyricularia oryzae]